MKVSANNLLGLTVSSQFGQLSYILEADYKIDASISGEIPGEKNPSFIYQILTN
jgi:hypothetical protein